MNNGNNQLEINKESRRHKNKWFTEKNNRTAYQAYRDTILNYLYYKKAHSSRESKPRYQELFDDLRNIKSKGAKIYLNILNKIHNIPHKNNSVKYRNFLNELDELNSKYGQIKGMNNFSNELINLVKKQKQIEIQDKLNMAALARKEADNYIKKARRSQIKIKSKEYLIKMLQTSKTNENSLPNTIKKLQKIIKTFKNDEDMQFHINRIKEKYGRLLSQ